jgi:hypothetical protein
MSKFTTRIDATGPSGNVFVVLATAVRFMRQLNRSPTEISILQGQVNSAKSYSEALGYVRQWFPVDTGDDD